MCSIHKTLYDVLDDFDQEDTTLGQTAQVKKAIKKLREIDEIKKKSIHTPEQLNKLDMEMYWQNIAYPPKIIPTVDPIAENERKKRQEKSHNKKVELRKKREFAILQEQERVENIKRARLEEELEQERIRIEQERIRLEKELTEEQIKQKQSKDLETEFQQDLNITKSIDKTFRNLSLKYHPDKNNDRREWASEIQQKMLDIKHRLTGYNPQSALEY